MCLLKRVFSIGVILLFASAGQSLSQPIAQSTLMEAEVSSEKASVEVPAANIRSGPGMEYEKMTVARKGDILTLLEAKDDWYRVKLNEEVGWIYKTLVRIIPEEMKEETPEKILEGIQEEMPKEMTAISPSPAKPEEPLISNLFYETDIREALHDIAAQAGVNIIADDTVQGIISLEVRDMPLEECLRMMLVAGGYTFRRMDGYYLVGAVDPSNPTFNLLSTTEYVKLNYINAKDVPKFLSKHFTPFVQVNEEVNTLTITASPEIIARIKEDIAKIDVAPQQIMIEALVTEISSEARKELGIDWSWTWDTAYDRAVSAESTGILGTGTLETVKEGFAGLLEEGLSLVYTGTGQLTSEALAHIKGLVQKGKIKIRANPRIATLNGKEAKIFVGKEEYYSIVTGPVTYPYTRLEAVEAGITLKITPYIADTGEITIKVEPEVSHIFTRTAEELPVISKRSASTTVRVKDGETIAIGGLLQKTETEVIKRFPILGYIPIINILFKSTKMVSDQTEVVIFVTPHIL